MAVLLAECVCHFFGLLGVLFGILDDGDGLHEMIIMGFLMAIELAIIALYFHLGAPGFSRIATAHVRVLVLVIPAVIWLTISGVFYDRLILAIDCLNSWSSEDGQGISAYSGIALGELDIHLCYLAKSVVHM